MIVDLSHPYDETTIFWPTEQGFQLEREHAEMTVERTFGAVVPSVVKKTFVAANVNAGIDLGATSVAMTVDSNFCGANGGDGIR